MNFLERTIYSVAFLCYRWTGITYLEQFIDSYENKMIKKNISRKPIHHTPVKIIHYTELTNEHFLNVSNHYRNPVVIKGFMKDSDAVKKWDLTYLKEHISPDFKINCVHYEKTFNIIPLTFTEFIERKDEKLYINNNHTILANYPDLFKNIKDRLYQLKKILYRIPEHIHIANLFIGYGKNKGSNLHCGGSGNFFCMITGKKHWTLINPKYSCLLKGVLSESGIHGQTRFDMLDQPLETHPKMLTHIPRYEITLEAGDILWNPPWWWHRIYNIDEGLTIGSAIRLNKVTKLNLYNNPLYTLSGYTYLLYNSWLITLYEWYSLKKGQDMAQSKKEKGKSNVLYQIESLIKKYPSSLHLDDILPEKNL